MGRGRAYLKAGSALVNPIDWDLKAQFFFFWFGLLELSLKSDTYETHVTRVNELRKNETHYKLGEGKKLDPMIID